jgi:hypothetical protein
MAMFKKGTGDWKQCAQTVFEELIFTDLAPCPLPLRRRWQKSRGMPLML